MALAALFLILVVCLILGTPIAIAFALSSLAYIMLEGLPSVLLLHTMVGGIDSFPLLAIPFFIFAGHLMNGAGLTDKIFDFAKSIVGCLPGGLGYVNVGSSVIFAGMSGAAVADAGGLGLVEIKAMRKAGYDDDFSVGITAASSIIGPIIPPSLPMVIFGVMASTSIGKLFAAGIIPGLLMATSLIFMVYYLSKKRNYPIDNRFSIIVVWHYFKLAILPLLMPVIIVGGIVSGAFTPTEAAVCASFYALFLGLVVYKSLTFKDLINITIETIETTSSIMFIVAGAAMFAWILTANQVANIFADSLLQFTTDPTLVLFIIMGVVLLVGLFMETIAAITILVPLLMPVALTVGIDPVHLGIVLILNLMLGLLTPPVGMVLYVLSKVSKVPFERCVSATSIFLIPLVIVLVLLIIFPNIVMYIPNMYFS